MCIVCYLQGMQIVLLRVIGGRGVGVALVGGRRAGLALDVEQRRVGEEGGRRHAQRVLLRLAVRVRVCV